LAWAVDRIDFTDGTEAPSARERGMTARKSAWIAICVILGAIFAGAIAEGVGASHAIAVVVAVLGGALGALVARYIG
jgi:hypothetical protein